ncbi:hypothetical protein KAT92_03480, partial [Candidatus Babeliales bacterium]|nr:hypothetical protein [Candidatus Babeliales bacterium]
SDQAEMLWAFLSIEELKIEGVQFLKDFIKQGGGYEKLDLYETGGFYKKILESEVWRDEQEVRVWMFVDTQKRRLLEGVLMSKMTKAKSVELLKYFIKQGGGYEKLESYETGGFYKSVLKSKVWLYGSAIKVWLLGDGYNFLKPSDQAEMLWAFLSIEELKIEGVQFLKDFIKHGGGYEKLESYKTGGFYKKILESEVWRDESTIKAWLLVDGFIWVSKFSKDDVIKEAAKYGLKIPQ